MVNPVDKLRKEQQKKLLLKQKKARQERNKTKFQKQSRDDVELELEKLRRKPKSMVNPKDEQKMKSLEKMLEEKREEWDKNVSAVGPNAKGPKDVGVGVNYDDFVGDRCFKCHLGTYMPHVDNGRLGGGTARQHGFIGGRLPLPGCPP